MKEIKRMFEELEAAEIRSNELDEALESDPENEELENAWNEAYEREWNASEALINEIVKITNGMIDNTTARKMIAMKRNELKNLISRIA